MVRWNQYLPRGWQSTVRLNWHYATCAKWWPLSTLGTVRRVCCCFYFPFFSFFSFFFRQIDFFGIRHTVLNWLTEVDWRIGSGRAFQIGGMRMEKKCFLRSRRAGFVSSESGSDDKRVWGPTSRDNKVSQVDLSTLVKPRSILNVSMQSPLVRRSFRDVRPIFNNFSS